MSISARYRTLATDTRLLQQQIRKDAPEPPAQVDRELEKAAATLEALAESVGEIPQFLLEKELTPVLLKAHGALDRGRLQLEEAGDPANAKRVWDMEQLVYRLLNDL